MKPLNCLTINTDASFYANEKIGGYAFYIICDSFKIQKGGYFKARPQTPTEAEMMCMANAIATLLAQKELPLTKLIVINSDALHSFEKIGKHKKDAIGKKVACLLSDLRKRMSYRNRYPKFEFRHVKAHNGTPDARSYVNDWCDREAKKWAKIAKQNLIHDTQNK